MKKFIDFNSKKRMISANDFEKDFLKLMIYSVYKSNGKFKKKNQCEISK